MYALLASLLLASCDLGTIFSEKSAWEQSAVDFAVEYRESGFNFADGQRNIVNCLGRGKVFWHGLEVWEARVYFERDTVARLELSMYNRGDDRDREGMNYEALQRLLSQVAEQAEPKGRIGSNPEKKKVNNGYRYFKRFSAADPTVELTWGVNGLKKQELRTDFVRVTVYPRQAKRPQRADAPVQGIVSAAKIRQNVTKLPNGDVYIPNVPMVDQGQKGYCAAAVSERVLRYFGKSVDEHEIAQMAGTSANSGTRTDQMIETVKAVGGKCRLGFNEIVSMTGDLGALEKDLKHYNKCAKTLKEPELTLGQFTRGNTIMVSDLFAAMKPKVLKAARVKDGRYKQFLTGVKKQIDAGIPVIWGVTLGYFPEPGLPQTMGGHMRLIIGYNAQTQEILYTDTWGGGHELKRMPQDWAFTITHDAFFLKPL